MQTLKSDSSLGLELEKTRPPMHDSRLCAAIFLPSFHHRRLLKYINRRGEGAQKIGSLDGRLVRIFSPKKRKRHGNQKFMCSYSHFFFLVQVVAFRSPFVVVVVHVFMCTSM